MLSSERKTNTFSKEIRLGCLQNQSAEGAKPWENTASKYYHGIEARTWHKCIFSENVNQTRYCFCYINFPSWIKTVMNIKFITWWFEQKCKQRWNNNYCCYLKVNYRRWLPLPESMVNVYLSLWKTIPWLKQITTCLVLIWNRWHSNAWQKVSFSLTTKQKRWHASLLKPVHDGFTVGFQACFQLHWFCTLCSSILFVLVLFMLVLLVLLSQKFLFSLFLFSNWQKSCNL